MDRGLSIKKLVNQFYCEYLLLAREPMESRTMGFPIDHMENSRGPVGFPLYTLNQGRGM